MRAKIKLLFSGYERSGMLPELAMGRLHRDLETFVAIVQGCDVMLIPVLSVVLRRGV